MLAPTSNRSNSYVVVLLVIHVLCFLLALVIWLFQDDD